MSGNPYASPSLRVAEDEPRQAGSFAGRAFGTAFLVCYPLPFLAAVGIWIAHSTGAIAFEAPIVPIAVQGGSLLAAMFATRTLARAMLCGPLFGPTLTGLYLIAVAAAWPLARACFLLLGSGSP